MEHNFPSAANTTVFAADTLQTDCCFSKPRTSVNLNQFIGLYALVPAKDWCMQPVNIFLVLMKI
jgi:hypothetical protein